jgi:hypothetical protein
VGEDSDDEHRQPSPACGPSGHRVRPRRQDTGGQVALSAKVASSPIVGRGSLRPSANRKKQEGFFRRHPAGRPVT